MFDSKWNHLYNIEPDQFISWLIQMPIQFWECGLVTRPFKLILLYHFLQKLTLWVPMLILEPEYVNKLSEVRLNRKRWKSVRIFQFARLYLAPWIFIIGSVPTASFLLTLHSNHKHRNSFDNIHNFHSSFQIYAISIQEMNRLLFTTWTPEDWFNCCISLTKI